MEFKTYNVKQKQKNRVDKEQSWLASAQLFLLSQPGMGWFSTIIIGVPIQWWVATFSITVIISDLVLLLGMGVIHLLYCCCHWCSIQQWLAAFSIVIAISIPSHPQPVVGPSLHWPHPCPCPSYPVVGCGSTLPVTGFLSPHSLMLLLAFPHEVWLLLLIIGLLGGVGSCWVVPGLAGYLFLRAIAAHGNTSLSLFFSNKYKNITLKN